MVRSRRAAVLLRGNNLSLTCTDLVVERLLAVGQYGAQALWLVWQIHRKSLEQLLRLLEVEDLLRAIIRIDDELDEKVNDSLQKLSGLFT